MLGEIDHILNGHTMYRVVVYGLGALLGIAAILGMTGAVSISAGALLLSVAVLVASCYVTNKILAAMLHAPTNSESWLISALILACILPPVDSVGRGLFISLAGALAMASKFIIRYRGNHIFNPAALGAGVVSITGWAPATWWIATPWLAPFTVLLALVVLRKQRRFELFFCFAAAAVFLLILTGVLLQGMELTTVLRSAALSWPIIFFGSIMLTEPATLPPLRYYQLLLAVIVGLLFTSQLHVGVLSSTPQGVLLIGNLLTVLAIPAYGYMVKLAELKKLAPNIYQVSFARPSTLRFQPGQYAEITLPHPHADSRGNRRTFSIESSTTANVVSFAFKVSEKGSSFKTALTALKSGSTLRLSHVAGEFTLPADVAKPVLLIAGGIGVTPYHSMITSLTDKRDIVLLYLAATPEETVFRDDFARAAQFGVRTEYVQGRLTPENLNQLVPDIAKRQVYLSGPDGMVRGYKTMLGGMGVSQRAIRTDHFTGY